MAKRQFQGDPLDLSWENGPWANDGKTVEVYGGEKPEKEEKSKELELPLGEGALEVLKYLRDNGPERSQVVANKLEFSRSQVFRVYKKFSPYNFIDRIQSKNDGRVYIYNSPDRVLSKLRNKLDYNFDPVPNRIDELTLTPNELKTIQKRVMFPNMSQNRIGEEVEVSQPSVYRCLRKYNLLNNDQFVSPEHPPRYRDEDWLRAKYWDGGMTMKEIAEEMHVTPQTIKNWMIKNDIKRRDAHARPE